MGLLRIAGLLQFVAAVPLLLYAATASSRLRHLGVRAAGTTITLAGVAVTSLLAHQLPRSLAGVMLAVALLAELSTLSLVMEALGVLVAIGRFGSMATLVAAGVLLPSSRPSPRPA